MRLTELYMKNFIALNVAQGKREIHILFPEDKMINLLYGDMGSGKTFILGHCQPWHTFGTLDVRNGDPQIIEGENGQKLTKYKDGDDHWIIRHEWIWNQSTHSHTVKHFFQRNDVEMNANGNLNSFNDLVKIDFGIDQDYLKMIRIGDNVSNMTKMKGTERKAFIASKLEESQFWLILYKKLTAELRNLNSQAKFILNNLGKKSFTDIDALLKENEKLRKELKELTYQDSQYIQIINQNRGVLATKLEGKSLSKYKETMQDVNHTLKKIEDEILEQKELQSTLTNLTIEEVSSKLGGLGASEKFQEKRLVEISSRYDAITKELDILRNQLKLSGDGIQKENLRVKYEALSANVLQLEKEVSYYPYEYSYQSLLEYSNTIDSLNMDIQTLTSYNMDDVLHIMTYGNRALTEANKKADILRYKAILLGSNMNNMQYAGTYRDPYKLFRPPFCPTKDCPYYQSHPSTIAKSTKKSEITSIVQSKQSELMEIQTQIAQYENYSYIVSLWNKIKSQWDGICKPLRAMKLLKESHLNLVVAQNREWVDQQKLIFYIELAQKRGELFTLRERLLSAKDQLNRLNLAEGEKLEEKIQTLLSEKDSLLSESEKLTKVLQNTKEEIQKQNQNYLLISQKHQMEDIVKKKEEQYQQIQSQIEKMEDIYQTCLDLSHTTTEFEKLEMDSKMRVNALNDQLLRSQMEIEKMQTAKMQYYDIMEKIRIYQLISESASPKSGIPMEIVEMYMNECLDTINDLISGIFEDDLEIENFRPTEDSFLIPYNKCGHTVDDISKASQGETSIIGISISFAMMENSMTRMRYNIPLLDEPDGALHAQDRNRFFVMLMKHMKKIESEQVIIISHNQTFEGYPIHIILTSDEGYTSNELQTVTRI